MPTPLLAAGMKYWGLDGMAASQSPVHLDVTSLVSLLALLLSRPDPSFLWEQEWQGPMRARAASSWPSLRSLASNLAHAWCPVLVRMMGS